MVEQVLDAVDGMARKTGAFLALLVSFAIELVKANVAVARAVLKPTIDVQPGILTYPTRLTENWSITLLANLITLTPGTLTVDVWGDRRTLFVHTLDVRDEQQVIRTIEAAFERKLLVLESRPARANRRRPGQRRPKISWGRGRQTSSNGPAARRTESRERLEP
ncbi:MAG: hypothetical protein D6815_01355 [Candidatus Dadabacteria bacterium]|nr:MAG: hypothetical protein D6815_01355 [Candidatus Dadabacteria bacterium]